jgi:hypothetical protein
LVVGERSPRGVPFEEHMKPTRTTDVTTGFASSFSVSLDFRVFISSA